METGRPALVDCPPESRHKEWLGEGLLWGWEYILTLLSSLQDAMPKTLGPKVLALDKELEPWFTQSEAAATACAPCLLLSFSAAVHSQKPWTPPGSPLSLTQPCCTSLMPWTWVSGVFWFRGPLELLPR